MVATKESVSQASHPPAFVSAIVSALLRSPVHGLMSKKTMLLTLKGRKSSNVYTIPVSYIQEGKRVTCFTNGSWWKNLRGGAPVTLVIKGRAIQGRATPILDDQEQMVQEHVSFLQKMPDVAKYRSVRLNAEMQPDYDDVVRASQHFVLIQIQLAE